MFKRLAIGKKIIFGFSNVLALLAVVGGTGYYGLTTAACGFTDYREMARDANLAGRLQANLLMVCMSVKDYLSNGAQKSLQTLNEHWKKVEAFQAEAQKASNDPERTAKIVHIEEALADYSPAFAKFTKSMLSVHESIDISAAFYSHFLITYKQRVAATQQMPYSAMQWG